MFCTCPAFPILGVLVEYSRCRLMTTNDLKGEMGNFNILTNNSSELPEWQFINWLYSEITPYLNVNKANKKINYCCIALTWNFWNVGSVGWKIIIFLKHSEIQNLGIFSTMFSKKKKKNPQSEQNWVLFRPYFLTRV